MYKQNYIKDPGSKTKNGGLMLAPQPKIKCNIRDNREVEMIFFDQNTQASRDLELLLE